jgi:hypothetical protein
LKQEAAVDDTAPEVLQAEARHDQEIAKLQAISVAQDENAIGTL